MTHLLFPNRTWPVAVTVFLLVSSWRAAAQTVDVRALDKTMKTPGQSDFSGISDSTVEIKPRHSLSVRIVDTNPLLLTYSATVTKEETEQHKTAATFLNVFGQLLTTLGFKAEDKTGAGGGPPLDPRTLIVEALNFNTFHQRLDHLYTRLDSLHLKLSQSIGSAAAIDQLKDEVRAWSASKDEAALQSDFNKLVLILRKCTLGQSLDSNQGTVSCSAPVPLVTQPAASAADSATVATGATGAAGSTGTAGANGAIGTTTQGSSRGQPAAGGGVAAPQTNGRGQSAGGNSPARAPTVLSNPTPPPGAVITTGSGGNTIQTYTQSALLLRSDVLDSAKVVAGFAADVAKLRDPLEVANVGYLPNEDQHILVKIAASDVYKSFLDDETKVKRDGAVRTFTVTASPYSAAGWSLGAAVIVPVIDDPTFTAERSGDRFIIRSEAGGSQPYQIAAMLSVEPRPWRDQVFGFGFQVGVSPAKERVAFYAGPHFRLYAVTLGGGLLLQRTNRLDNGLSVGQQIAAESDLKIDTRLRPGGYIQASMTLFKK
jgi:hypothetical protein